MTTSIVMPVWAFDAHARALAAGVVDNIRETTPEPHEIIMVYAGVDPQDIPDRCDRFIGINPPQGWAAASNIGMLHASGEHLVVGSVDIRVPDGWLGDMLAAAGTDTVVSPYDHKPGGGRRDWDTHHRGSFWGGWFLFCRSILEKVGYLDGYMMRAKADMDWAIRVREAGFKTVRVPVRAMHVEPHHTLKARPDPYVKVVRRLFHDRWGVDRFGEYEGLPYVEGQ